MNNYNDKQLETSRTATIRDLNDQFRRSFVGGAVMLTASVIALGADKQALIIAAVRAFEAFNSDNDPYGEHDFGSLEVADESIFFKIDYFDLTRAMHSANAADPTVTERVLTIMLASDY